MKRGTFSDRKSIDARRFSSRTWGSISGSIIYPQESELEEAKAQQGNRLEEDARSTQPMRQDDDARTLNTTLFAQPALFTIEYAMTRLWQSLGITPDAIVGHSMGEYVAACLAGVLSLEDALRLIATRARLVNELPQGAMLAVMLPEDELLSAASRRSVHCVDQRSAVCAWWRVRLLPWPSSRRMLTERERHLPARSECPRLSLENARSDRRRHLRRR